MDSTEQYVIPRDTDRQAVALDGHNHDELTVVGDNVAPLEVAPCQRSAQNNREPKVEAVFAAEDSTRAMNLSSAFGLSSRRIAVVANLLSTETDQDTVRNRASGSRVANRFP